MAPRVGFALTPRRRSDQLKPCRINVSLGCLVAPARLPGTCHAVAQPSHRLRFRPPGRPPCVTMLYHGGWAPTIPQTTKREVRHNTAGEGCRADPPSSSWPAVAYSRSTASDCTNDAGVGNPLPAPATSRLGGEFGAGSRGTRTRPRVSRVTRGRRALRRYSSRTRTSSPASTPSPSGTNAKPFALAIAESTLLACAPDRSHT